MVVFNKIHSQRSPIPARILKAEYRCDSSLTAFFNRLNELIKSSWFVVEFDFVAHLFMPAIYDDCDMLVLVQINADIDVFLLWMLSQNNSPNRVREREQKAGNLSSSSSRSPAKVR